MVLDKKEYFIQDDGIWISKKALETLRQHYIRIVNDSAPYDMYYVGKADVIMDIIKLFEPHET